MRIKGFILIALVLIASACTQESSDEVSDLYGTYRLEQQLYKSSLNSQFHSELLGDIYTLTEDVLIITDENGSEKQSGIEYLGQSVDEQAFGEDFLFGHTGTVDFSSYQQPRRYILREPGKTEGYILYKMDDELWLATTRGGRLQQQQDYYVWELHELARQDSEERS